MESSTNPFAIENAGETIVHPMGIIALLLASIVIFLGKREHVFVAILAMVCFISYRQCIAIAGVNLFFSRLLIIIVGCRAIARSEWTGFKWGLLDSLFATYTAYYIFIGMFSSPDLLGALKYRLGHGLETFGLFLAARTYLNSSIAIENLVKALSVMAMVLSVFFALELSTGRNIFSIFGGVPQFTEIREGRLRCQGAFGHPLLAGIFWATFLPLMIMGASFFQSRWIHFCGAISAIVIVICSASSTPIVGVVVGLACWLAFPWRRWTTAFAIGTAMTLVALHFVMKAPVWALIQRINLTSGNSGYHRYILFDGFIKHANEWWLVGSSVGTAHWGHFTHDTANQIVAVGVASGIVGLALFIAILLNGLWCAGKISGEIPLLGWGIGVSMFVLCTCFIGISVWGQLHFAFAVPFAMAGAFKQILDEHETDGTSEDAEDETHWLSGSEDSAGVETESPSLLHGNPNWQ